jgi:hypothetical protein
LIGDRKTIAIELGEKIEGSRDLFEFNLWFLDYHITNEDSVAYLKVLLAQSEEDILDNRDLNKFEGYFSNMSALEAHKFILSTRDPNSKNYDLENDEIYPNQRIFDWGPNTDNVTCFLLPIQGTIHATLEIHGSDSSQLKFITSPIDTAYFSNVVKEFIKQGARKI